VKGRRQTVMWMWGPTECETRIECYELGTAACSTLRSSGSGSTEGCSIHYPSDLLPSPFYENVTGVDW
jgi:hypothetical protein